MSECQFPLCKRKPESNGYCFLHRQYAGYSPEIKEKKPIAKKSEKMEKMDREYKKIVKEMLGMDDRCEIHSPECTGQAQGLHHMKRRGINLLNRKYLKRACNACNGYLEKHPKWAFENKLSIPVHKKETELRSLDETKTD